MTLILSRLLTATPTTTYFLTDTGCYRDFAGTSSQGEEELTATGIL